MAKYRIEMFGEVMEEEFDTEEEAQEYALYLCSCSKTGAEILNMSNPGDYPFDEESFEYPEYEIIEIDD